MHKSELVLEDEMHRAFEIQIDHQILARRPVRLLIHEKKTCQQVDFTIPAEHRTKIK